jgi:hypothetical protein
MVRTAGIEQSISARLSRAIFRLANPVAELDERSGDGAESRLS